MTRPLIVVVTAQIVAAAVAEWHRSIGTAVRKTAIGVIVTIFAFTSLSGCGSTALTWDSSSDAKVYLVNNTTALDFADGSTVDWNTGQGVVFCSMPLLAAPPSDQTLMALPAPTKGGVDFIAFLAPKGSERKKSDWKLWGDTYPLNGKGALLPSVWPGYLSNGNRTAVKNAGGTYSMGVAYLKDNDTTVVSAYYTTITIDAGKGTWKFVTPPK
jgi:hypothetical protein